MEIPPLSHLALKSEGLSRGLEGLERVWGGGLGLSLVMWSDLTCLSL